jgi:hypothetical protein
MFLACMLHMYAVYLHPAHPSCCVQVPKMLYALRHYWSPGCMLVSFKLETDESILLRKVGTAPRQVSWPSCVTLHAIFLCPLTPPLSTCNGWAGGHCIFSASASASVSSASVSAEKFGKRPRQGSWPCVALRARALERREISPFLPPLPLSACDSRPLPLSLLRRPARGHCWGHSCGVYSPSPPPVSVLQPGLQLCQRRRIEWFRAVHVSLAAVPVPLLLRCSVH